MKDGLHNTCKSCRKKEAAIRYNAHKDSILASNKIWYTANKEKHHSLVESWYKRHPQVRREKHARRYASKTQSVPSWADKELIQDMYAEAIYNGMQVDHIVPIRSKKVCGLHWEGNMQLLNKSENASKGNHYWPNK